MQKEEGTKNALTSFLATLEAFDIANVKNCFEALERGIDRELQRITK